MGPANWRWSFCAGTVAAAVCLWAQSSVTFAGEAPGGDAGRRFALLVAVDRYLYLGDEHQLQGCRNDSEAVRNLLTGSFGFRDTDIVQLLDERATAAAVRRELAALVARVRALPAGAPPAQVVIHYSGHGGQASDQPPGHVDRDEDDCLDETLMPHDVLPERVTNDIRDDELHAALQEMCADGRANAWVMLDCCHSGTACRGETRVRRYIRRSPTWGQVAAVRPKSLPRGVVMLSACPDTQTEPEYAADDGCYGLLTYFACKVLGERGASGTIDYRTLRDAIELRYRADGKAMQGPAPQLEGDPALLSTPVLGARAPAGRITYLTAKPDARDPGLVRLSAGLIYGVARGSLFEIYDRPEDAANDRQGGRGVAWVMAERVGATASTARVVRPGRPASAPGQGTLPPGFRGGVAVERQHAGTDLGLTVRIVRAEKDGSDGPPYSSGEQLPRAIRLVLQSTRRAGEIPWLRWTASPTTPADVLIRVVGERAALIPAAGVAAGIAPSSGAVPDGAAVDSLRGGWGPYDLADPERAAEMLRGHLRQFARVRNLVTLAANRAATPGGAMIGLSLDKMEVDEDNEPVGPPRAFPLEGQGAVVRRGEYYALRLRNLHPSRPVYVTVVVIDPDLGVNVSFPRQPGAARSGANRLDPGQSRVSSLMQCDLPAGPRTAVALATYEPHDFEFLAQPDLPKFEGLRSRSLGSRGGQSLEGLLLRDAFFRDHAVQPSTRFDTWATGVLNWTAVR